MATLPTSEESARAILNIFKALNRRPGDVIQFSGVYPKFNKGRRSEDYWGGIGWLIEEGCVESDSAPNEPPRKGYRLTQKGFDRM
jgi:hypothetical protein